MQPEHAPPGDTPSREGLGYKHDAYVFVSQALAYTLKTIGEKRHVSGPELLEGIRRYALSQFGLLSRLVFENWGVRRTDDFGNIVYCLIGERKMSKTGRRRKRNGSRRRLRKPLTKRPRRISTTRSPNSTRSMPTCETSEGR